MGAIYITYVHISIPHLEHVNSNFQRKLDEDILKEFAQNHHSLGQRETQDHCLHQIESLQFDIVSFLQIVTINNIVNKEKLGSKEHQSLPNGCCPR